MRPRLVSCARQRADAGIFQNRVCGRAPSVADPAVLKLIHPIDAENCRPIGAAGFAGGCADGSGNVVTWLAPRASRSTVENRP